MESNVINLAAKTTSYLNKDIWSITQDSYQLHRKNTPFSQSLL